MDNLKLDICTCDNQEIIMLAKVVDDNPGDEFICKNCGKTVTIDDGLSQDAQPTFAGVRIAEEFNNDTPITITVNQYKKMMMENWEELEALLRDEMVKHFTEQGLMVVKKEEYDDLKEKAGKWDLSQLTTIQTLYGTHALNLINKELYEHDEKELASTIMKAISGAIKTGGIKIVKKEVVEEEA